MNPRSIVHIEIPSADDAQAKSFYSQLCGWGVEEVPFSADNVYVMFHTGNVGAALSGIGEHTQPGDVLIYFHSDDLDADMARVSELGGQVILPRQDVEGFGALGIFLDPTGNRVAFWQRADSDSSA